jgi:anti-sigma factor RsiW
MNCSSVRRKLVAYADGELTPDDKGMVSLHLYACPGCREELAGLAQLNAELDRFEDVEARPYFTTRLRQRIVDRRRLTRHSWLRRLAIPAGAAAAVVLMGLVGNRLGNSAYNLRVARLESTGASASTMLEYEPGSSLPELCDVLFEGGSSE